MTKTYPFDKSLGRTKSLPLLIAAGALACGLVLFLDVIPTVRAAVWVVGLTAIIYGSVRQRQTGRFVERFTVRDGELRYYLFIATGRALEFPAGTQMQEEAQYLVFRQGGKVIAIANRNQLYGKRSWEELVEALRSTLK